MEAYIDKYNKALGEFRKAKHAMMNEIVTMIKTIACKPIHIGNTYYYYVNHNCVDVPAYCNENDYNENNPEFLPVYDEEETYDFGWVRFEECCRLFEVIRRVLMNSDTTKEMAERYKQYTQGWAYIPPQDLGKYEKAFKQFYNK